MEDVVSIRDAGGDDDRITSIASWKLFIVILLVWSVISTWTRTLHVGMEELFSADGPLPFIYLFLIAVILTALLFLISQYLNIDWVMLIGGASAQAVRNSYPATRR
jgi:uncharacterized membrane protein (DUF106 family)